MIVFDLDGTLADSKWREHYLNISDWKTFYKESVNDKPIESIYYLIGRLASYKDVAIVTGRPQEYEEITKEWLSRNHIYYDMFAMRKTGDFRSAAIVKTELIKNLNVEPTVIFEDNPKVAEAFRKEGWFVLEIK